MWQASAEPASPESSGGLLQQWNGDGEELGTGEVLGAGEQQVALARGDRIRGTTRGAEIEVATGVGVSVGPDHKATRGAAVANAQQSIVTSAICAVTRKIGGP